VPSSRKLLCALSLLSCLLTLGASGDDFCLLRLAASLPVATSEPLPLDDPNTDFLASADSRGRCRTRDSVGDDSGLVGSGREAAAPLSPSHAVPQDATPGGGRHLPRTELTARLRC